MNANVTALANSALRKRFIAFVRLRIGEKIQSIGLIVRKWAHVGS
jgi:hypothetical protein